MKFGTELKCTVSGSMVLLLLSSQTSFAQQLPPPIEQPAVDEYGVEVQSGRYGSLSVPLITIGGEGASKITRTYAPQDGREMIVQSIFNVQAFLVQESPPNGITYEVRSVRYPGGSLRFRRIQGSNSAYTPEFATGATFDTNGNFTDKYGVRIEGDKITYPDGREIWGGTRASGVDAIYQTIPVMKNNFGFVLISRGFSDLNTYDVTTQAVNLVFDYCNIYLSTPCINLQKTRTARAQKFSPSELVLTDAASGVTRVVFEPQDAYYDPPTCYIPAGGTWTCFGYKYIYNYPKYIYYPGSTNPDITINYIRYGEPESVEHHEILVGSLNSGGVSVGYSSSSIPNGSAGGGQSGSQVYVSSSIDGALINRSRASSYAGWGIPGLSLNYVQDALDRSTNFGYNQKGDIASIASPEGNFRILTYDARFNVTQVIGRAKTGSGAPDLVTTYTYPASCTPATQVTCNLPLTMTDPKGNVTDYTYNSRGQVLTEISPAPTAGASRPTKTSTYAMRTAYIKDASGVAVPAGQPISLLTRTSICRTLSSCAGTADEVITVYDYGPTTGLNNLNLRGIGVTAANEQGQIVTRWTCFQYNYFGEKIAETQPNAGLTSCP